MRLSALMLALLFGAASAVALVSCGGGSNAKLLPGATAEQIESNLEEVRQLAASGDCVGAEDAVGAVDAEVEELNGVAPKLKTALEEGTSRLSEVVGRCEEESSEEETEPSTEADVEAEELEQEQLKAEEKAEKAQEKAEKQEQKEEEKAEPPAEVEEGALPPQSEGKGKAKGHEEAVPPPAPEPKPTPEEGESGGVGPGVGVE